MAAPANGYRLLVDALAARFGGGAYAAIRIARHLALREDVACVSVLTRSGSIVHRGLADAPGVHCPPLGSGEPFELLRRIAWEAARLPALVRRDQFDALISMSGMLPRAPGCALVSMLGNPVMYERRSLGTLLRRLVVRRTARFDARLVAPSRLMADLVAGSVGRPCAALPWGVDHDVFVPAATPGSDVLCVADFYVHKRHDLILAAWERLDAPRPRLRLVGNPAVDPAAHARVRERAAALPERDRVVFEHGLSLRELVATYQSARAFIMPSEHESFCMPLAEAMACGVPAVARDIPSLRETGGDGAHYIRDDDASRWSDALAALVHDGREYEVARERAIASAARYSWDAVAAGLVSELASGEASATRRVSVAR
jgi:glycosyltransferase involved in cell wall biosynthesis